MQVPQYVVCLLLSQDLFFHARYDNNFEEGCS